MPDRNCFAPMLCASADHPPEGQEWLYELKLDGFRAIGGRSDGVTRLWSRNQKDFSGRFLVIAKGLAELPNQTVIDGEIVAVDKAGKPSFNLLQGFGAGGIAIVFYAFDLLMFRGSDFRAVPLEERRSQLNGIIKDLPDAIRYSETFNVPVSELMSVVRLNQLEGIIAKRAGSHYRSGERCADWVKWRANRGQEFVVGGYICNGDRLDSILIGHYENGNLIYAGRVRAGLPTEFRRIATPYLAKLLIAQCPFRNLPERTLGRWGEGLTAEKLKACSWLEPQIVARVEFVEWTPENRLRHPRFVGLRTDKDARDVVRE